MRKLEGFELVEFVSEEMSNDLGVTVEYKAVVFNSGIHLDTYINGEFFEKRKFSSYEELEAFMYEVLENLERKNALQEVTNDDRMEAISILSNGLNKRDNVKDSILDLEAIISLAQSAINDLENDTQVYDKVLDKNVSLNMALDIVVEIETRDDFKDRPQECIGMTDAEARLFIVKDLTRFLQKHNYEIEEGGF